MSTDVRLYASWITFGYIDGSVEVRKRYYLLSVQKLTHRSSIDKPEEPVVDNVKTIMTSFDGGYSFRKPRDDDNRGSPAK